MTTMIWEAEALADQLEVDVSPIAEWDYLGWETDIPDDIRDEINDAITGKTGKQYAIGRNLDFGLFVLKRDSVGSWVIWAETDMETMYKHFAIGDHGHVEEQDLEEEQSEFRDEDYGERTGPLE